jgi:hypothetical protein
VLVIEVDKNKQLDIDSKKLLRLTYYFLQTLSHEANVSSNSKYFDSIQQRVKLDSTLGSLRILLSIRSFSGYIYTSANKGIYNVTLYLFPVYIINLCSLLF